MSFNLLCSSFKDIKVINRRHEQINLYFFAEIQLDASTSSTEKHGKDQSICYYCHYKIYRIILGYVKDFVEFCM